jgi:hypothetical protein
LCRCGLPICGLRGSGASASSGIRAQKDSLLSIAEKEKFTMLPRRRDAQTPDLEDREMPRRRGRQMTDPTMEREMHDL